MAIRQIQFVSDGSDYGGNYIDVATGQPATPTAIEQLASQAYQQEIARASQSVEPGYGTPAIPTWEQFAPGFVTSVGQQVGVGGTPEQIAETLTQAGWKPQNITSGDGIFADGNLGDLFKFAGYVGGANFLGPMIGSTIGGSAIPAAAEAAMLGGPAVTGSVAPTLMAGASGAQLLDPSLIVEGDPIGTMANISERLGIDNWREAAQALGYESPEELLQVAHPEFFPPPVPTLPGTAPRDLPPSLGTGITPGTAGTGIKTASAGSRVISGSGDSGGSTGDWGLKDIKDKLGIASAVGSILSSLSSPTRGEFASLSRASDSGRRQYVANNMRQLDDAFKGFDDKYFDSISEAFKNYYSPQVADTFNDAERSVIYRAPGGVGSTEFARNLGKVQRDRSLAEVAVGEEAANEAQRARSDVAGTKASLTGLAEASEDPDAFGTQAVAAAQSAAKPPSYSPLADLFNRYSSLALNAATADRQGFGRRGTQPLTFGGGGNYSSSGGGSVRVVR